MEPPASMESEAVRDEKLKVLRALKPITATNAEKMTVRGQYRAGASAGGPVKGYLEELEGVRENGEVYFTYFFKKRNQDVVSEKLTYA